MGYCCPDFLQGGVATFFYLMMVCTQSKLWYVSSCWQETKPAWFFTGCVTLLNGSLLAVPNQTRNSPF